MLNSLSTFLKTRWVLLTVLIIFICLKIPHLSHPFYCDEAWVYAPAVKMMAANGPSLLPTAIPSDYSRGHPLLFHFLGGLWIKYFGSSNIALHSFPLFISILFLIAIHEGCHRLFGYKAAILSLLLTTTQVIFFVQASLVEPEIMVALLTFLSLYFYSQDRLFLTSAVLSMLLFTKESGAVFGAVIGMHALLCLFIGMDNLKHRILRVVAVMAPALLIGVFFVLQKSLLGWYVLPLHSSLVQTDWNHIYGLFRTGIHLIFQGDPANYILTIFIILLALVPTIRHRDLRYLFLCLPAIIIYLITDKDITDKTGDGLWIALFALSFTVPFYYLFKLDNTLSPPARRFLLLLGLCFVAYLCFSSIGVITYRYLLVEIVFLYVFLAVCINTFIIKSSNKVYYAAISGILLIGLYAFQNDKGNDDTDLEAFPAMRVQKRVVAFLEKEDAYDKEITGGRFWELVHFTDPLQGFLSSKRTFSRINWETVGPQTTYAFFDNLAFNDNYDRVRNDSSFSLVYRTTDGKTWAEVYKRK